MSRCGSAPKAGLKTIARRDLIGQSRTDFGGFIGFEMAFTDPIRSSGVTAMARTRRPVRLSGSSKEMLTFPAHRGSGPGSGSSPIKARPRIQVQATVAARVRPFLGEFLTSNELRQHVVIPQVERLEPDRNLCKGRSSRDRRQSNQRPPVQDSPGKFHRHRFSLPGTDL